MKLIDDLRRENLAKLREEFGGLKKLSGLLDREDSQVSQWLMGSKNSGTGKPRGMRSETARFIDDRCGKPPGWLDQDHASDINPTLAASLPSLYQNQPLAPVQQAQAAINGVASLDVTLNNLSAYLAQAEAGRSDVVGPMLAALAKNPDDQALIGAIKMLLTPSGFAETQRKAA